MNTHKSKWSFCPWSWRKRRKIIPQPETVARVTMATTEQCQREIEGSEAVWHAGNVPRQTSREEAKLTSEVNALKETLSILEYQRESLEQKNNQLRDLVQNLEAHVRRPYTPILAAQNTADVAVIASLGFQTLHHLNVHDVITFHAISVLDNDYRYKEIGRGAFGRVLLGRLAASGDVVIIKQPLVHQQRSQAKAEAERKTSMARIQKEALVCQLFSGVDHFPKLFGTLVVDDMLCIVQEFIGDKKTGQVVSLLHAVKGRFKDPLLSWSGILDIAVDILEGIELIHSQGFLHNDIKADNVLLELHQDRWRGFVIDLGLLSTAAYPPHIAIRKSVLEEHHGMSGIVYIAPEVVDDGTALSLASDVYSVGVLLVLVGQSARLPALVTIGEACARKEPRLRPRSLCDVISDVIALKDMVELHDHS